MSVFYGKKELLESIDFPKLEPAPNTAPERAEMGTQSHEGIAGAAATVDFYASLTAGSSMDFSLCNDAIADSRSTNSSPSPSRRDLLKAAFAGLRAHSSAQVERLWQVLSNIRGVRLYGPPPDVARTRPCLSQSIRSLRRKSHAGLPNVDCLRRTEISTRQP